MNFISLFFKDNPPGILKFIARQARKPSGLFGKFVAGKAFNKGNKELHDFALGILDIKPNEQVLEIGFGNGLQLYDMAKHEPQAKYFGIDFSTAMVSEATKMNILNIKVGRMKLYNASVEGIPFDNNKFDRIYSANTVYFWPNHDENIKEVHRVLKPGGQLYLGFRTREQMEKIPFTRYGFTFFSEISMVGFLQKGGFLNVEIQKKEDKPFDSYIAVGTK
ncbi:MAG: class I SAM-dependent methyltransferase [Bacteroidota bacterium]|nr:class I SAM-dependent methyltransferase [Bacteroidota bacterium]